MASIKKKSSGGGGANWMDTYGDMVTLLLCFFVLLYSISSLDEAKWMIVVQSFNKDALVSTDTDPKGPKGEETNEGGNDLPYTQDEVNEKLEELLMYLQTAAATSDAVSVTSGDGYVFLSFEEGVFFEGESSALKAEGRAALDAILPGLEQAGPYIDEVQIMGHTAQGNPNRANTIRGDRQLSSDRANEVLIYLLENSSPTLLDPARFQAIGMGQWRPIATNDTAEGRAKNRRVEMMISGRNVEEAMSDSVAAYYAETNQTPPELEAVDPAGSNAATEPETPPVDQTALEILGPDAVMGGANAGAGAG